MSVPRPTRRVFLASTLTVLSAGILTSCAAERPATPATAATPATPATPATAAPQAAHVRTPQAAPAPPAPPAPAAVIATPPPAHSAGTDRVDVDKCWTNATATSGGQLLVSARSSDRSARLFAYRADGRLIGEVQNDRGQRYGGTVFPWQATDPGTVTVRSSSGGSVTVRTTPWQAEN